jgi:hypothetical protein
MPGPFTRLVVCMFLLFSPFVDPQVSFVDDRRKYRHDVSNTGSSSETGIASSNVASQKLKWSLNTGGAISGSPAVATVNGISAVFVGSSIRSN